jgi:hypothetical protein
VKNLKRRRARSQKSGAGSQNKGLAVVATFGILTPDS